MSLKYEIVPHFLSPLPRLGTLPPWFRSYEDKKKADWQFLLFSYLGYYPANYEADIGFYLQADIYSYGMVIAFCLTGDSPWGNVVTTILEHGEDWDPAIAKVTLPSNLPAEDHARKIIELCYTENIDDRPKTAQDVVQLFFRGTSWF